MDLLGVKHSWRKSALLEMTVNLPFTLMEPTQWDVEEIWVLVGKGGCTSFSLLNCRWEQHLRCDLAKRWCYIWKLLHSKTIAETTMGMVPKSTEDGLEKVELVALDRQPYRLSYKPICVSKMESRNWNTIVDLYLGIGRPGFSFRFCQ